MEYVGRVYEGSILVDREWCWYDSVGALGPSVLQRFVYVLVEPVPERRYTNLHAHVLTRA